MAMEIGQVGAAGAGGGAASSSAAWDSSAQTQQAFNQALGNIMMQMVESSIGSLQDIAQQGQQMLEQIENDS